MIELILCSKLFVASLLFLTVNAETNKVTGPRQNFQVATVSESLTMDGSFLTVNIDPKTIVPLITLMKKNEWDFFDMTLTIPDIHADKNDITETTFECRNNRENEDSVAICTVDTNPGPNLKLVVTNNFITGIFDDFNKKVQYQIHTVASKQEDSFIFTTYKNEDVPISTEGVSVALSPRTFPINVIDNRNKIVNQDPTNVGPVDQSNAGINAFEEDTREDTDIAVIVEDTVVDILFYYTWRAMCQWTDQIYASCTDTLTARTQLENIVKTHETYINEVFTDSLTGVRLVATFSFGSKEGYDEQVTNTYPSTFLYNLTNGEVNDVDSLRKKKGADLVVGIAFGKIKGLSGIAWTPTSFPMRDSGFSSTISGCGLSCLSSMNSVLTHEIGHNFGCDHDREVSKTPDSEAASNFGFNHCDTCSTTMMSYKDHCIELECEKVTRLPYFSNPAIVVTYGGETFAIGDSKRNNAQMIINSKKGIAYNYDTSTYLFDTNNLSNSLVKYDKIEFTIEGVTAVTINNLSIVMTSSTENFIKVSTKRSNELEYSVLVKEGLVGLGSQNNALKDESLFDNFPSVQIAAGEKVDFFLQCNTACLKITNGGEMVVSNDDISVKGREKYMGYDLLFQGAVLYSLSTTSTAIPTGSATLIPSSIPQSSPTGSPTSSGTSSQTLIPSSIPQSSPTGSPTSSGTSSQTLIPSSIPQSSPTGSPTFLCEENEKGKFKIGRKKITCKKLSKNNKKRKIWCAVTSGSEIARVICPITCGICTSPPTSSPISIFSCSKLEQSLCKESEECDWMQENTCTFRNKRLTRFKQKCGKLNGFDGILETTTKQCQKMTNNGNKKICKVINGFCIEPSD